MAEAAYGGTYGGSYRLRLDISVSSQDYGGNYSTLHIVAYLVRVSSSGGDIFNNNATGWGVQAGGGSWGGTIVQGHLANGQTRSMLDTYHNVGHNGDGTMSIGYAAQHNANNSPYQTSASLSGGMGLPTIPRYTSVSYFNVSNITDTAMQIDVTATDWCDILAVSLNGGASWENFYGDYVSKSVTIGGNLPSTTNYAVRVSCRRRDSGLWTEAGNISATTLQQNNFHQFFGVGL